MNKAGNSTKSKKENDFDPEDLYVNNLDDCLSKISNVMSHYDNMRQSTIKETQDNFKLK